MNYNAIYTTQQHLRRVRIEPPGLCWQVFAPIEDVEQWPQINPVTGIADTPIKLKEGAKWYELKAGTGNYREVFAGDYRQMQITSKFPGNSINHIYTTTLMSYHQFVVLFKERDGIIRVMGNRDAGCSFKTEYDSGSGNSLRNRQLGFYWESALPPPVYIGSLEDIQDDVILPPFGNVGDFSDDFADDFNN